MRMMSVFVVPLFVTLVALVAEAAPARPKPLPKVRPGAGVGVVSVVNGGATSTFANKVYKLEIGSQIFMGDVLTTAADGRLKVVLNDDTVINLGSDTTFVVESFSLKAGERKVSLAVKAGRFLASVSKWFGSSSDWQVETPAAVAGVRGTTLWGDTEVDAICALYGSIEVKSKTGGDATNVKLDAGKCAAGMKGGKTDPLAPTAEQVGKYLGEVLPKTKHE
ncbi:MAG: FecR domain-containing protein [Deltaproteobacteria bacterium]|nr:FecR domain-containing protein [Deltaproteobacteria bacterium]